ncbi:tyrosyl-tRNA synthetase [Babesia ovis]|uniref:Tyrosine--tRNA ligase n=1 Tax=Babesia ovis TaxID=5869 RepID=A0A9W5TAH5_BABOV|nr:tyrosyl-tRNA synthetase [Babesia ovis]
MARGFNVVVVLGGGTTLVGDPSFKTERTKATLSSSEHDNLVPNAILNRAVTNAYVKQDNYAGILGIVKKILTRQLDTEKNGTVSPSWFQASELDAHNISNITSTPNNIIVVNNRDLYDRVTLSEYLDTVARHMSVGRMLSRDSIRNRLHMSDEDGITTLHKANMDLAEFVYMSLQAMDFVHVASKFNAVIQLGGSDQMGNIISGIELASGLGDMCKPLFGITTPLLQTRTGEKVSKSNAEKLLRITVDTAALAFWSHFRNVDDEVVQNYLQLLTQVPLHEIETTMGKHINEAKVLLADELTSSIFTADFTNALRKHWVNGNIGDLIKSQGALTHSDYDTFLSFTKCVPRVELSRDQLESGIPFADLMDRLRTPQLATGVFYSNRRAIREGTCRINGQVVTEVDRLVTNDDLLTVSCEDGRYLQYIALQFGKRQLYFAIMA